MKAQLVKCRVVAHEATSSGYKSVDGQHLTGFGILSDLSSIPATGDIGKKPGSRMTHEQPLSDN